VRKLDVQKTSDLSVMACFAQDDYSGNAFSLGLGGNVADSISSLEGDEPRILDDGGPSSNSLATMLMRI